MRKIKLDSTMYKRLPPLNSLKAFECAARHLSFTKAADELFVTQAAVSHQIKLLEDFLGIILFKRKNRALELTELGKNYFLDISKILNRLVDATDKVLVSKDDRHLTISAPQTFGMQWLVPNLSSFNQLYPELEVRLKGVDQDVGFLNSETDVAIYYGRGDWQNLQVEKLVEDELLILASPELLARKPIETINDLKEHHLIHIHDHDNWQNLATFLQLDELDIQHGAVFSHTFMGLQAALHGQGIVLADKVLAQQEIDNGKLKVVLPFIKLRDPKSFYVVNQLDKRNDPTIQAFKDWIMQAFKKDKE